jgi:hypothetical protein
MREADMIRQSTITCPVCGTSKAETMPADACQYFYECIGCATLLRPKPGDCCVFCSYGSVQCPPIQAAGGNPLCCQSEEGQVAAEIRPGVQRPDWSAVTRPAARAAIVSTAAGHVRGICTGDQGFRRCAARVDAGATETTAFDDGDLRACPAMCRVRGGPAWPAPMMIASYSVIFHSRSVSTSAARIKGRARRRFLAPSSR